MKINCAECLQEICRKPSDLKPRNYCSRKCQNNKQYKLWVEKWLSGKIDGMRGTTSISNYIRRYLFEKHGNKCQKCGWSKINPTTGKIPLTVEHIDGNYKNNLESNLELICPNCHSLTSTYCALNKGQGRENRYKKSRIDKCAILA